MLFALALLSATLTAGGAAHPVEFWRAVVQHDYAVPAGGDAATLANELVDMLASPNPELRDEIAYSTLTAWIYRSKLIDPPALAPIVDRLLANLTKRIGERDTDSVFERSFSALILSVVIARDNAEPFLDAAAWRRIEDAALTYLLAEQDVRGYDPATGWMHSTAHTADLLKFLGRSRHVEAADQARILDAVGRKLAAAPVVFTHGEDERLARALLSLADRPDFDGVRFAAWTASVKAAVSARPTLDELHASQNRKNLFAKLEVLLSNDSNQSGSVIAARDALRAELKTLY